MNFQSLHDSFWTITITGLVLGSIYALVALGYTLVYGVLRLINFAHSEVWLMGAFGSFATLWALNIPNRLGNGEYPYKTGLVLIVMLVSCLLVSMLFSAVTALVVERFAYRPLRKRNAPRLVFLISAIGASFMLSEAVGVWGVKGRDEYTLPRILQKRVVLRIFDGQLRNDHLIVLVTAVVMMIGLTMFVNKTRTGRGIRAVSQDGETARLMGVNTERIIQITFVVGGLMAGAAAFFFEMYNGTARFSAGFSLGVKSFIAAVLGGIGNLKGALLGGLLLGLVENYGSTLLGNDQKMGTVVAFVILVLVLMFRPSGLLGESLARTRA